ncbi:hypothetical protein L6452_13568 [Arctium lappa]|uniref:Uncharacterized protein n=1 Tax=Arctium lappa TaxID=4217 RepID=A0ACB9CIV8_ARCLA|nr:hypothetical protein L6452_13568 [Arctium lappa]
MKGDNEEEGAYEDGFVEGSASMKSDNLMLKKERHSHPINGIKIAKSHTVGFHEVKKAYRAKAHQLHPDVIPSSVKEECTKKFVELREAYEVLSDPNSRRLYDLSLVDSKCDSRMVWEMQLEGLKRRSENCCNYD